MEKKVLMSSRNLYLKYKKKYIILKNQVGAKYSKDQLIQVLINFNNANSFTKYDNYLLTCDTNNYDDDLVKLLADTLEYNINTCEQDTTHYADGSIDTLYKTLCHTQLLYQPIASDLAELTTNSKIINGAPKIGDPSSFGSVFKINLDGADAIIKIPIKYNKKLIIEAIINLCIINKYILENPLNNLVFTYGLFFCEMNTELSKKTDNITNICRVDPTKSDNLPNIHLIQQYLGDDAKTLRRTIIDDVSKGYYLITLDKFKNYISQILSQLADLEQSPFELIHNDLHNGNVMIKGDKAYIID
jgi:hypothetical protein